MKTPVEKRKPSGIVDYIALALTTFGVGYIPGAPGTYGSAVGVGIYLFVIQLAEQWTKPSVGFVPKPDWKTGAEIWAIGCLFIVLFSLLAIWASGRAIPLLGNEDPSEAVVDEVLGQLITFMFIPFFSPFGGHMVYVVIGFVLFRLFDILKPYPINRLQDLPAGIGICMDDIVAGIYAGVTLALIYAFFVGL